MPASVAIVSGAAQGIGRSIALRLAEDGLDVAVNDLEHQREKLNAVVNEIQQKGRRSLAFCGDVSSESDVKDMIDKVVQDLGGLDVMVANAGLVLFATLEETSVEDWDRILRVNLRGTFLQIKYAAAQMIKQSRGGRIISASSQSGKRAHPSLGAYSASKFAIRGLTQTAAQEYGKHNITVNAYAPGAINTTMTASVEDQHRRAGSAALEKVNLPQDIPWGEPEDIAGLVSYLVKPESRFMTGQSICIDGGLYFD